jgi:pilus assembly protein CpaB
MKNKRLLIALLAAVVFGSIAAISVSRYLAAAQGYTRNLNDVVVAKVDIPVGTKIIPEQLVVAQFPKDVTPEGAFPTAENLVGRVVVTRISAREPVTDGRLAPEGTAGGLSSVIPEGYRAMTVRVDEVVGVSGFILPGTLVDIVVVTDPPKRSGLEEKISKIVLQNIKVLASGQNIDRPQNERETEARVTSVTLQVTPEQAEKLALAQSEGRLQLVMRNSIDQNDEYTPGANKSSLLSGERALPVPEPGLAPRNEQPKVASAAPRRPRPRVIPAAAELTAAPRASAPPPAPPRPSVEVIEGAKKKNVEFP